MRTVKDTRVSLLSFLPGSKSGTVALSSTICICPPAAVEENGWRKGVGERERKDGKAKRMQAHTDTDTDTDAQTHRHTQTQTQTHSHTHTPRPTISWLRCEAGQEPNQNTNKPTPPLHHNSSAQKWKVPHLITAFQPSRQSTRNTHCTRLLALVVCCFNVFIWARRTRVGKVHNNNNNNAVLFSP